MARCWLGPPLLDDGPSREESSEVDRRWQVEPNADGPSKRLATPAHVGATPQVVLLGEFEEDPGVVWSEFSREVPKAFVLCGADHDRVRIMSIRRLRNDSKPEVIKIELAYASQIHTARRHQAFESWHVVALAVNIGYARVARRQLQIRLAWHLAPAHAHESGAEAMPILSA